MSKRALGILLGLAGAGLGVPAGCTNNSTSPTTHPSQADSGLEGQPAWRHLTATWKEAGEIRSDKRGPYPFTRKEKEELLKQLEATQSDIDTLTQAGFLNESEAGLLKKEVPELLADMMKYRAKELAMATCYDPMMPLPAAKIGVDRLSARVALLEKLAAAPTLHPQAAAIVLASIQTDLHTLQDETQIGKLSAEERTRAELLRQQVSQQLTKIQSRLPEQRNELEQTPQWQAIIPIWEKARRMADSGKSTTAERKQIDVEMQQALAAVEELGKRQLLLSAEVELMRQEAETLHRAIYRNRPIDLPASCYFTTRFSPAQQSMGRLRTRLPLLKQIVEAKTVHPAALRKLLPTLEADIQTLSRQEDLNQLRPDQQALAVQMRQEAAAQLAAIKAMLEKQP